MEGAEDRLRPLPATEAGGVAELGQEGAVLVRVQKVLVGVRVRNVEFILFNERYVALFLTINKKD